MNIFTFWFQPHEQDLPFPNKEKTTDDEKILWWVTPENTHTHRFSWGAGGCALSKTKNKDFELVQNQKSLGTSPNYPH